MLLKSGCSSLKFNNLNLSEVQNRKMLLFGCPSIKQLNESLTEYLSLLSKADSQARQDINNKITYIESVISNHFVIEEKIPRGVLNIITQALSAYVFSQSVHAAGDVDFYLNKESYASRLFEVSLVFMISSELAKLFNSKPDDFSLANIWLSLREEIKDKEIASKDEIDFISVQFENDNSVDSPREQFIKEVLLFRNKQVAHNSTSNDAMWESYNKTIKFVLRVYSLLEKLVEPQIMPRPIIVKAYMFDGIKQYYDFNSFNRVKRHCTEMCSEFIESCSTNLITLEKDSMKPFLKRI
ncbi:hypothetical protein ACI45T_004533 [Vibrio vulnificus]|nr:hypothetical protein [Vibrio vulnificus]